MVKNVMLRRLLIILLLPMFIAPPAMGSAGLALPDLGSSGISLIGGNTEEDIGRSIVNQLRRSNLLLEDPEITEYLQHLGSRLVAAVDNGQTDFEFFVVKDDSINAFALPGGYIGVHSGLILHTDTESELASVLAHEVAHVTQRHISRRFQAASGINLKSLAILLGAIALAASGAGGDDVTGALMLGQGLAMQEQINFTRAQEYESDRLGIKILTDAGFNPRGMVTFFETMQRTQRLQNSRFPEFLSTHPLSLSRVSEAAQRVQAMGEIGNIRESRAYPLMKARLGVLSEQRAILFDEDAHDSAASRYARALKLLHDGEAETAAAILRELRSEDDSVMHFHVALGNALLQGGNADKALDVFENATRLFPDNIPVGLAHANALRHSGQAEQALKLLRDLFNRRNPEPSYVRTLAQTAADANERAESHYYMGEYYLRMGDLGSARIQLQLAVENADPGSSDEQQYRARFDEVRKVLEELRRADPRRQPRSEDR